MLDSLVSAADASIIIPADCGSFVSFGLACVGSSFSSNGDFELYSSCYNNLPMTVISIGAGFGFET